MMRSLKKCKWICFVLVVPLVMTIPAASQEDTVLTGRFRQYVQQAVQEKIYAHTDRDLYLAGDIAWFKLYLVDGSFHRKLDLSKIAYVELIDQQNKPLVQAKIEMHGGEGSGSFFLPVTAVSGNYTLRAYTNWMKNAGAAYFFRKNIAILNTQTVLPDDMTKPATAGTINVRFFPEGGNLVAGLAGKLACQATDAYGKGIAFSGRIVDETNQNAGSFKSLHAGIGSFLFTPTPGHDYRALIETADGKQVTQEIPAIYQKGTTMQVRDADNNKLSVHIENNNNESSFYLLVHTRQTMAIARQLTLNNGRTDIVLDKSKLGDGISHITLFNRSRQPVCERLYFKYPSQQLELTAKTTAQTINARSKVDIELAASANGKTVNGASLSMSVFRIDSLQKIPTEDINSYLLLGSDLRGSIESPDWYFDPNNNYRSEAIDNLMLTHGWRRFAWEKIMQGSSPAFSFVPEYNGHLVTGKVIDTRTGKPAPGIPAYLSIIGKRTQFYPSLSDQYGAVRFEMKEMVGSSEIIVQTNMTRDSMYRVEINNPFSESTTLTPPGLHFPGSYSDLLLNKSIGMQVQNIYTGDQRRKFNYPQLDTAPFFKPDATYYLDAYTRFITVEEVLREYVNFMDVIREKGKLHVYLVDLTAQTSMRTKQTRYFVSDPLTLVDGVPIFDPTHLMAMDPRKIRKLEILNHREFVRGSYFDGVLNWQTYTADLSDLQLDPRVIALDYEGLQPERIFYSPVYASEQDRNSRLPDFRTVLHWAPNLHTNESGKTSVGFYSSDLKGKYAVVVQGLSPDGKAGSGLTFFEVK